MPQDGQNEGTAPPDPTNILGLPETIILATYLVLMFALMVHLTIALWQGYNGNLDKPISLSVLGATTELSPDVWLLAMVMVSGAVGSFIHAGTSFADFVGNRQATKSWTIWYVLRPLIGSALAFVMYVALRGGLLTSDVANKAINVYGFASIGALSGLFSKQATDKLKEVFDTLFRTASAEGDGSRKDKLDS